jgi:hypothetical protein
MDHTNPYDLHQNIPTIPYPNHLIWGGSQTACNLKLGYHDSCTLCKGSTLYPRILISSLIGQLESLLYAILYTSIGIWLIDHYMLLQRFTICRILGLAKVVTIP